MDRLTREILEKIAKELGKPVDDPQVLQVVYRMVWEVATGEKPKDVKREPNPMLSAKDDPALRAPDAQDLTDLVDSILEDPKPRTEFLAKPRDAQADEKSTGLWLKGLLGDLKSEPSDSQKRKEAREWVANPTAPRPGPAEDKGGTDVLKPAEPAADLAALLEPQVHPAAAPPSPVAAPRGPREKRGPKFARKGQRTESPEEALTTEQAAKSAPAWLISLAAHVVVAVVLMNIVYFTTYHRSTDIFRISIASAPSMKPPDKLPAVSNGTQDHGVNGHHDEDSAPSGHEDPLDPQPGGVKLPEVPKDITAPSISLGSLPTGPGVGTSGRDGLGGMFEGRGGKGRADALLKNGGDADTEAAVARGLKWLASHQGKGGSWGLEWGPDACKVNPPCGSMACRKPVGVTAIGLLAFLGAGFTHLDGQEAPYSETVRRAAEFLSSRQLKDGHFEEAEPRDNYTQAITTYVLCELLAMTQDPRLRRVCEKAVEYICAAQQDNGGWDYDAQRSGRGDVSITGWMVMALRSARAANLSVPAATWNRARVFYGYATDEQKPWIAYSVFDTRRDGGTMAMQASGLLARNYLGMPRGGTMETRLLARIAKTPPAIARPPTNEEGEYHHTLYYVYYATLVMFYNGGEEWKTWNRLMKNEILPMQLRSGHEDGSWPAKGIDTADGGRCYATAMAILNLEVYYRYLPSYKAEVDLLGPLDDPSGAPKTAAGRVKSDTPSADLIEFLHKDDTALRRAASRELCRRREEGALADLLAVAKDETTSLKVLLIDDLSAFGENERVLAALVGWLDGDATVQGAAMRSLKKATGLTGDTVEVWKQWWAGRPKK